MIQNGINYIGSLILNVTDDTATLQVTEPGMWDDIYYGIYMRDADSADAEIEVVNTYTLQKTDINLHKVGTKENSNLDGKGAIFALYQGELVEATGAIKWGNSPLDDYDSVDATSETNELSLEPGYYKLVETQAPGGFMLLSEPIFFKVDTTGVTLIQENGNPYEAGEAPDMWFVNTDENGIQLIIKNEAIYNLPSAGGPGIYLYMLGGALLLMTGALMVYNERKKEVSRS